LQVLVRQVKPGLRVRQPYYRDINTPIPDIEPVVHAMFDLATAEDAVPGCVVSVREVAELGMKYAAAWS
jgi:hypothetical protein